MKIGKLQFLFVGPLLLSAVLLFVLQFSQDYELAGEPFVSGSRVAIGPIWKNQVWEQSFTINESTALGGMILDWKFATYKRENNGMVRCSFIQGDVVLRRDYKSEYLKDNGTYTWKISADKIKEGRAIFRIEGFGEKRNLSPTLWASKEIKGLPCLKNGVVQDYELVINVRGKGRSQLAMLTDYLGSLGFTYLYTTIVFGILCLLVWLPFSDQEKSHDQS